MFFPIVPGGKIDIPVCPPIIYHIPTGEQCRIEHRDLSSKEKIQEEQLLFCTIDPAILDQIWSMDPHTGEIKQAELKPDEIAKMIFYGAGQEPDFLSYDQEMMPSLHHK